ncbi:filaggrin-like [Liolophura sinensis]|uniref:filaggrin-like n=1 Tax=Liolophura sinensis TaxID=3198878 RepID=UPI0031597C28
MRKRKTGEHSIQITKFIKSEDNQVCAEWKASNQARKRKESLICLAPGVSEVENRTLRKSNRLNKVTDLLKQDTKLIVKQNPTRSSRRLREKRISNSSLSSSSSEGLSKAKRRKVETRSVKCRDAGISPLTVSTSGKTPDAQDCGQDKMYNRYIYEWNHGYGASRDGYREDYRGRVDYRDYNISREVTSRASSPYAEHDAYRYSDYDDTRYYERMGQPSRYMYEPSWRIYNSDSRVPDRAGYDYNDRRFAEDDPVDGYAYEECWLRDRNFSHLPPPDRHSGAFEHYDTLPEARLRASASWSGRTHLEEYRGERSNLIYRLRNSSEGRIESPRSRASASWSGRTRLEEYRGERSNLIYRLRNSSEGRIESPRSEVNLSHHSQEQTQRAYGISEGQKSASGKASVKRFLLNIVSDTSQDTRDEKSNRNKKKDTRNTGRHSGVLATHAEISSPSRAQNNKEVVKMSPLVTGLQVSTAQIGSNVDTTKAAFGNGIGAKNSCPVQRSSVQKKSISDGTDSAKKADPAARNGTKHVKKSSATASGLPQPAAEVKMDCKKLSDCGGGDFIGNLLCSRSTEAKAAPELVKTSSEALSRESSERQTLRNKTSNSDTGCNSSASSLNKTSSGDSDSKGLLKTCPDITTKALSKDVSVMVERCYRGDTLMKSQAVGKVVANFASSAERQIPTNTKHFSVIGITGTPSLLDREPHQNSQHQEDSMQDGKKSSVVDSGSPRERTPSSSTLTSTEVDQRGVSDCAQVGSGNQATGKVTLYRQNDSAECTEGALLRTLSNETISKFSNSGEVGSECTSRKHDRKVLKEREILKIPSSGHSKEYSTGTSKTAQRNEPEGIASDTKLQDSKHLKTKNELEDVYLKHSKANHSRVEEQQDKLSEAKHTESQDLGRGILRTPSNILDEKEFKDQGTKHQGSIKQDGHVSNHQGSDTYDSKIKESGRHGSIHQESERLGSKHQECETPLSKPMESDRHGPEQEESGRHGSKQQEFERHGSKHQEPERQGSKYQEPERQGSKYQEPERQGSKYQEPDRHGSKHRESDRHESKYQKSDRRGSKHRECERHGSRHRESERDGSKHKEPYRHGSRHKEPDTHGCKHKESDRHGTKHEESDRRRTKSRESDRHGSEQGESDSDTYGSKHHKTERHGSKSRESDRHGSEQGESDSDTYGSKHHKTERHGSKSRVSGRHGSEQEQSERHRPKHEKTNRYRTKHEESDRHGTKHEESDRHGTKHEESDRHGTKSQESDIHGYKHQESDRHRPNHESESHESEQEKSDEHHESKNKESDMPDQAGSKHEDSHDSGQCKPEVCASSEANSHSSSKASSQVHAGMPNLGQHRKRHHSAQSNASSSREASEARVRHTSDQQQRRLDLPSGSRPSKLSLSSPRRPDRQRSRVETHKDIPATNIKPTTPNARDPLTSPDRPSLVYRIKHKSGSSSSMEHVSPLTNLEFNYRERCERPSRQSRDQEKSAEDKIKGPALEEHLEDPLDDNYDSDDSFLDVVPDFLRDIQAAGSTPTSNTLGSYGKGLSGNLDVFSDSEDFEVKASANIRTLKFSLDTLLTEKIEKEEKNRELDAMREELTEGIKQGGFVKLASEVELARETDLLPEHQDQLEILSVSKQKILEVHPGVVVFTASRYKCLFSESLPLSTCGFTPGSSQIDRYLASIQPEWIVHLLTSRILGISFEKVSCPDAVLTWLFYIISVHPSRLVVDCCRQDVEEILVRQQEFDALKVTWCPSLKVILRVLLNYGASLNSLCQDRSLLGLTDEEIRELNAILEEPPGGDVPRDAQPGGNGRLNRENFRQVIQVIALGLQGRPLYSTSQLIALAVILCNSALDITLVNDMLKQDFQICLACLIERFPKDEWPVQAKSLCETLSTITTHHHNKVCLVELFPLTPRGQYIRRRLSYIILCDILNLNRQSQDLTDLKVEYLAAMVPKMRALVATDLYLLSSVITLMDRCVGNEILRLSEKKDLRILMELVRTLTGDVRDSVTMLDRTKVKDMMVRLTSTWTFMMQSMGSKQPSLFAWRKNDSPVKVETLSSHLSDSDSDASDEEEEDEEDEEEVICGEVEILKVVPVGSLRGEQSKTTESLCADKIAAIPEAMDISLSEDCVRAEDRHSLQRLLETDEDVIPDI